MTDLEIQAAVDRAVTELARRLRPWAVAMADPEAFAAAFIAAMREEGWRPPLRRPLAHRRGTGAPPDRHADELAKARRDSEAAAASLRTRALNREDTP
jgi:ATP phosphoribosyltransferase regulatory subunit HisZ